MTIHPTSEELTRAMMIAFKGDDKMTAEERAFVQDVIWRRDNAEAEAFLDGVLMSEFRREPADSTDSSTKT